jgi:hypothetical protein
MRHIRYFFALCENPNFTQAAKRCGVSATGADPCDQKIGGRIRWCVASPRARQHTCLRARAHRTANYLSDHRISGRFMKGRNALSGRRRISRLQRTPLRLWLMCTIAPVSCVGVGFVSQPLRCKDPVSSACQDSLARASDRALCMGCRHDNEKSPRTVSGGSVLGWGRQQPPIPPSHGNRMTSVFAFKCFQRQYLAFLHID